MNFQGLAVEISFCLRMKMNDFIQKIKYNAPEIPKNNLDTSAQKFEVKSVPETILPITLNPPTKVIKPIITFRCITSFCFEGAIKAINPKISIGIPSIAGMQDVNDRLPLAADTKIANTTNSIP